MRVQLDNNGESIDFEKDNNTVSQRHTTFLNMLVKSVKSLGYDKSDFDEAWESAENQ